VSRLQGDVLSTKAELTPTVVFGDKEERWRQTWLRLERTSFSSIKHSNNNAYCWRKSVCSFLEGYFTQTTDLATLPPRDFVSVCKRVRIVQGWRLICAVLRIQRSITNKASTHWSCTIRTLGDNFFYTSRKKHKNQSKLTLQVNELRRVKKCVTSMSRNHSYSIRAVLYQVCIRLRHGLNSPAFGRTCQGYNRGFFVVTSASLPLTHPRSFGMSSGESLMRWSHSCCFTMSA